MLTAGVKAIHADFQAAVERFQGLAYDVMDTEAAAFHEDFYAFRVVIRELERRLAAIIIQVGYLSASVPLSVQSKEGGGC